MSIVTCHRPFTVDAEKCRYTKLHGPLGVHPKESSPASFCRLWRASEPIFGKGMRRSTFQWKTRGFQWKGGGNSVNEGLGKDFYRKGNSAKRFGPFTEPRDSENLKLAVLIPFPKIGSYPWSKSMTYSRRKIKGQQAWEDLKGSGVSERTPRTEELVTECTSQRSPGTLSETLPRALSERHFPLRAAGLVAPSRVAPWNSYNTIGAKIITLHNFIVGN